LRGDVDSIAVKFGLICINVLLAIVLARTLVTEGFDVYSFVFALITIMAIAAQMGLALGGRGLKRSSR
jgi:O-antigen/teichoic acid export membrane protein